MRCRLDELVVVDEEIALDRRPGHEEDAELDEREVHDDPGWTSCVRVDRASVQEEEREGQFHDC